MNRPRRRCPAGENLGRARGVETNAEREGSTKRGSRDNSNDVDRVCAEGNSRRSLLRRRRGMETGIRLVCEGRHSRGSPVPFGVCALPWSREKRFARFQRETRGGCGGGRGRGRSFPPKATERTPGKGETENTDGRPTGAAWRTSRRPTSPLSPTPFLPVSPFGLSLHSS